MADRIKSTPSTLDDHSQMMKRREKWEGRRYNPGNGHRLVGENGEPIEFLRMSVRLDIESRDWLQRNADGRKQSINMFLNELLMAARRKVVTFDIPRSIESSSERRAV